MNLFFDIDYTLVSMQGFLRPHVHEVFAQLKKDGHTIYVWSGMGVRWNVVEAHGLVPYVSGVHSKPIHDYHMAVEMMLRSSELPVKPDFIVDDYPEIVEVFSGMAIKPYWFQDLKDQEMDRAYRIIKDVQETGTSVDLSYMPGRKPQPRPDKIDPFAR